MHRMAECYGRVKEVKGKRNDKYTYTHGTERFFYIHGRRQRYTLERRQARTPLYWEDVSFQQVYTPACVYMSVYCLSFCVSAYTHMPTQL